MSTPDRITINPQPAAEPSYQGPPPTPDNFGDAFPDMVAAAQKGGAAVTPNPSSMGGIYQAQRGRNPLDPESQKNLDQLFRQVRANPFPGATVVNMHPWDLSFSATDVYLRGIVIPACQPGQPFSHHYIRKWNAEKWPTESGTHFTFTAIKPIDKALQFLRAFADPEVYGGGVIVYEGERHPDKAGMVELYNPDGRPQVNYHDDFEEDDEGHKIPIRVEIPIKAPLIELLARQRERRNEFYMGQVEWADSKYKSNKPEDRRLVTNVHRLMAEMLVAEGILPVMPDWNLATRMQQGLSMNNCQCGQPLTVTSYRCHNCSRIINPLEAFRDAAIEWEHPSMSKMSTEQWIEAAQIKAEREAARKSAMKAIAEASKKKED